jgi:ubiquinol oxidase
MRFFADAFFSRRYGNRAVVLETVAAVPCMVGGAIQHLNSLRRMKEDGGWIHQLLEEAENERMHLLTFVQIAQPSRLERTLVMIAQSVFYNLFFVLYLCSICVLRARRTGSSVIWRKKPFTVTRSICRV